MADIFPSLIGNEKIKSILKKDIVNHTVFHAYVIEGPEGSGRHTLAENIIKSLSCMSPADGVACGKCSNCRKIQDKMYADILYLNREEKATISVERVREMLETVNYSPNEDADYKFYIIEEAEKMTPPAQNALLLTLEEPPRYVVFILLCSDENMLLETIRSRTITLRMERFSADFIYSYLKSDGSYPDEKLKAASAFCSGSIGCARSILKGSDKSSAYADKAAELIDKLCGGKKSDSLIFVSSLKYSRAEFDLFFTFCQSALRDLIAYKNGSSFFQFYTDKDRVSGLCSRNTMAKLVKIYDKVTAAKDDIVSSNSNITLTLSHFAASATE